MDQERGRRQIRVRQDVNRLLRSRDFFLIGVNALVSLVISTLVVVVALRASSGEAPASSATPDAAVVPAAETQQTQPLASPALLVERPITYVVKAGDTLFGIAAAYGVSLEDLMRANDLTDPDHIIAGQRLIIPSGPVRVPAQTPTDTVLPFEPPTPVSVETPTGTATKTAKATQKTMPPTPTNTATPAQPEDEATPTPVSTSVEIQSLTGAGDLPQETLLIFNAGDESVQLDGWTISDGTDNEYVFVDFTLQPGSGVSVHTGAGDDDASDLYWGLDIALWIKGVTATLRDRDGGVVYQFSVE